MHGFYGASNCSSLVRQISGLSLSVSVRRVPVVFSIAGFKDGGKPRPKTRMETPANSRTLFLRRPVAARNCSPNYLSESSNAHSFNLFFLFVNWYRLQCGGAFSLPKNRTSPNSQTWTRSVPCFWEAIIRITESIRWLQERTRWTTPHISVESNIGAIYRLCSI